MTMYYWAENLENYKSDNEADPDRYVYKLRHLVENLFARLKQFRSIATRYETLARNFKSMLYLAYWRKIVVNIFSY